MHTNDPGFHGLLVTRESFEVADLTPADLYDLEAPAVVLLPWEPGYDPDQPIPFVPTDEGWKYESSQAPAHPKRAPRCTAALEVRESATTARRRKRDAQDAQHREWTRAFLAELDAREAEARAHREAAYDHAPGACLDALGSCDVCQSAAFDHLGPFACGVRPDGGRR